MTIAVPRSWMLIATAEPKKPTQNPLDKIQVKATPVNNRYRDAMAGELPARMGKNSQRADEVDCVPSSAPRRGQMGPPPSSLVACTPFADKVAATPARASAVPGRLLEPPARIDIVPTSSPLGPRQAGSSVKNVPTLAPVISDFIPGSSPLQPRKPAVATHLADLRAPRYGEADPSTVSRTLFQTPLKAKSKANMEQPRQGGLTGGAGKPLSIYQQLGWDEVDDL